VLVALRLARPQWRLRRCCSTCPSSTGRACAYPDRRAEARDFADTYVLAQHFGKDALLEQARSLDAGFDLHVLAQMMGTLGRFADDEIPLATGDVPLAKAFVSAWAEEMP
jgi:hypothetical protein